MSQIFVCISSLGDFAKPRSCSTSSPIMMASQSVKKAWTGPDGLLTTLSLCPKKIFLTTIPTSRRSDSSA